MRLPRMFRPGRHRSIERGAHREAAPGPLDCCQHCDHPADGLPHRSACPWCTGEAAADAVTLSWLGEIGAVTYWPQHSPEHDDWLDRQLADFGSWADKGWAFIKQWHVQAQAEIAAFPWWHPELS